MKGGGRVTIASLGDRCIVMHASRLQRGDGDARMNRGVVAGKVAGWCSDPATLPDMLLLYEELTGNRLHPPTAEDVTRHVVPALESAFARGELVGVETEVRRTRVVAPKQQAVAPPPPPPRKGPAKRISEKTFLDVVVTDTDGKPLEGRAYKLQLPDGRTRTGNLGSDGRLREENIDPGTGLLTLLPDKGEAIEASPLPANDSLSFVEIVLRDDSGGPVSGQRYEIELPDGTTQSGVTDARGVAVLHQIPRGDCKVTFPDLDADVWSSADEAASA